MSIWQSFDNYLRLLDNYQSSYIDLTSVLHCLTILKLSYICIICGETVWIFLNIVLSSRCFIHQTWLFSFCYKMVPQTKEIILVGVFRNILHKISHTWCSPNIIIFEVHFDTHNKYLLAFVRPFHWWVVLTNNWTHGCTTKKL